MGLMSMLFGKGPEVKDIKKSTEEKSQDMLNSIDPVETTDFIPLSLEQQIQARGGFDRIYTKLDGKPHITQAQNSISQPAKVYTFGTPQHGECIIKSLDNTVYFDIDMDGDGVHEEYEFVTHDDDKHPPINIRAKMLREDGTLHFTEFHDEVKITALLEKIDSIISTNTHETLA